ncbi:gap junction delta-2 protein [Scyliorhinus canicula]|uniref:gap junction delta-2 protein n=1 Tax=Scyliorhinus canicula TaxID=7830 RepID=UPI0018F79816|nr:gap junction delta-2 protein [Scyliorhinus canicula]XP_038669443.1 gap junction delta-2 protein [Scyliorhinus canicula]XP_038669444.1 gap junction delta-2 protein [Scyliorhinus canicula]
MGDWSLLDRLLNEVQNHSTVVGKIWLTMLLIFRILLVTLVGDAVYSDEQSKFTCNTRQPGCNNVCYDTFAPISHLRFWVFQIVLVSTPSIFYIVYVLHKIAKDEKHEMEKVNPLESANNLITRGHLPEDDTLNQKSLVSNSQEIEFYRSDGDDEVEHIKSIRDSDPIYLSNKVLTVYVIHVILRAVMEITFLLGQYYLYGFNVPCLFVCWTYPCPTKTDCFISRATEKTIFLNFMFGVSLACFLLNIVELHYLGWVYIARVLCTTCSPCCKKKKQREAICQYSQQNPLILALKDSFYDNLILKSSAELLEQRPDFLPSQAAISFESKSVESTKMYCDEKECGKLQHGDPDKPRTSKEAWL